MPDFSSALPVASLARRRVLHALAAAGLLLCLPELAVAGAYDDWFKAARMDFDDQVRSLLRRGFDPNTVEEERGDTAVTAGGVYELLRAAVDVLPEVAEYELTEARAGLRPGTPDNAPLLGPTADPRVVAATGHFRNGILLTPVSADALAETLLDGTVPEEARPFTPDRFEVTA